jgi:hypothetical protein
VELYSEYARSRDIALAIRVFIVPCLAFFATLASGQTNPAAPVRWQASYTPIYTDNVETLQPMLGPAFALGPSGKITTNPSEVISGAAASIKGSGTGVILTTRASVLQLTPLQTYQATFRYRILVAPSLWFAFFFTGLPDFPLKVTALE